MPSLRFCYQTLEFGETDIHLKTLRDRQQFEDVDGIAEKLGISSATWSFFGVIWESGELLAHLMVDYEIEGKRILEVGCGVALASLVLNQRLADITATDYHPSVERFLRENTKLNQGKPIPYFRTGWGDSDNGMGMFDLIIGSDLLYERDHIELLSGFINQHAKRHCEILLIDPGRGLHAKFSKKMISLGFAHSQQKPGNIDRLTGPFRGQTLRYLR